MWVATMDDVYAYKMLRAMPSAGKGTPLLQPFSTEGIVPKGKKIIGKLVTDRRGNIWVPGSSPHTFVLSPQSAGERIRSDEVKAMTEQMGYKVMVHRVAVEDDYL